MGGPWSWHSSEPSSVVGARVGAAIGGSLAAVFVFLIFFGLWRWRMIKRQREQEEEYYRPSAFAPMPNDPEPMPRSLEPAHFAGRGLRGGYGSEESFKDAGAVEEGLPSYAEAAGNGKEMGREKN